MNDMKKIKKFEDFYTDTSWTMSIDGHDITITIKDVEEYLKDEQVIDLLISESSEDLFPWVRVSCFSFS